MAVSGPRCGLHGEGGRDDGVALGIVEATEAHRKRGVHNGAAMTTSASTFPVALMSSGGGQRWRLAPVAPGSREGV
jgi:hypothetical protein